MMHLPGHEREKHGRKSGRGPFRLPCGALRILLVAVAGLLVVGFAPAGAAVVPCHPEPGAPDPFCPDPDRPFSPRLDVTLSTTQAGAHPELVVAMNKPRNRCLVPDPDFGWSQCQLDQVYIEQDLKRMVLEFPPGAMADPNAAPYCDAKRVVDPNIVGGLVWVCRNPEARVGEVLGIAADCYPGAGSPVSCDIMPDTVEADRVQRLLTHLGLSTDAGDYPDVFMFDVGTVYLERPRPGEQGRLVVFFPELNYSPMRTDISVTVRGSGGDLHLESGADDIPDAVETWEPRPDGTAVKTLGLPGALSDLYLILDGSKGVEGGHPLITNPTFCAPQKVRAELQGYLQNSGDEEAGGMISTAPTEGNDGKTVTDEVAVQSTGCDQVPYNPRLDLRLSDLGPDRAPAIDATVSQGPGEATTGRAATTFPSGFKVNVDNTAKHCSADDLKARTCPEESRIGWVTATSPLIPIGEELKGNIYLAGLTGDSIKFEAQLHGFIDLDIRAEGSVGGDLKIVNDFNDLPAASVSEFKLHFEGGEKGLLRTPRTCGPQTINQVFESHSGKRVNQDIPIYIRGCGEPELEVELSPRRPDRLSKLDLSILGRGHKIRSVRFGIARQLRWGYKKRKGAAKKSAKKKKKRKTPSAGLVSLTSTSGELSTRLKAKQTKRGSIRLLPYRGKGLKGAKSALSTFRGSLFRTRKRQPKLKSRRKARRKGRRKKAVLRQADLKLLGLPKDGATDIDMSLKGRARGFFIRTRKGCANPLHFVAIVTTVEGRRFALRDEVRLRGAGCLSGLQPGRKGKRRTGRR